MSMADAVPTVSGPAVLGQEQVLTPEALEFVGRLEEAFGARRRELLARRAKRQAELAAGVQPRFPRSTVSIRAGDWQVAPSPADLQRRHVEITGPTDRKMLINALNSGADIFMADFEDANAPTWQNMVTGQVNLVQTVRRSISLTAPDGRQYMLNDKTATLMVRPRGWHLEERHVLLDGRPISASLFDFGLYIFHNARELLARGTGPYFYLAKLENHLEAQLWDDVFGLAQELLGLPRGTIKVTVLIETILAALEMDEILYVLRDHIVGLNAGRWDYIFSIIKKFRGRPKAVLPDRAQVTMTAPFMRAYTELLVKTCHRRGAHAIGGMAAYIPSRRDPEVNEIALSKVRADKLRESSDGFDGTWVAHPDLVPVARAIFDEVLGDRPHQKERQRDDVRVRSADLVHFDVPGGTRTEDGLKLNISVAIQYLAAWLGGSGAVAINNLMEDTATAEISRAQVWQWLHQPGTTLADGRPVTMELYRQIYDEELARLRERYGVEAFASGHFKLAARLFDELATSERFEEFLTWPAYQHLE
jgi:malate synthase